VIMSWPRGEAVQRPWANGVVQPRLRDVLHRFRQIVALWKGTERKKVTVGVHK
jgi:hypothetical protein